jgi:uncharacterized protein with PQ loop repeat
MWIWTCLLQRYPKKESKRVEFVIFWVLFIFYKFWNLKGISQNLIVKTVSDNGKTVQSAQVKISL